MGADTKENTLQLKKDKSGKKSERQRKFINTIFKKDKNGDLKLHLSSRKFKRLMNEYRKHYFKDEQKGTHLIKASSRGTELLLMVVAIVVGSSYPLHITRIHYSAHI